MSSSVEVAWKEPVQMELQLHEGLLTRHGTVSIDPDDTRLAPSPTRSQPADVYLTAQL